MKEHNSTLLKIMSSRMKRFMLIAGILLAFLSVASCSDDSEPFSPSPSVEENETGLISSFSLESGHFNLPEDLSDLNVALTNVNGEVTTYKAFAEKSGGTVRFSIVIPKNEEIADGEYVMTLSSQQGISLPGRIKAKFIGGLLESAVPIKSAYPLKGSGTSSDPYLIGSKEDFKSFTKTVNEDESHGAGLAFRQTADLTLAHKDEHSGYLCEVFAGIYDGGGKTINLDLSFPMMSGAAMFGSLTGSASVSNLLFSNANINGENDYCGVVAGKVSGDVSFNNIEIYGAITGRDYVGSLAGYISGGNIVMSGISVTANVIGRDACIGGLVGKIDSPKAVTIKDCKVSSPVSGGIYVGGAFGDVYLTSSTTGFDVNGLKLSYNMGGAGVKGNKCIGGMSGRWHWDLNKKMYVSNHIEVDMSVEGSGSETGGVFGVLENGAVDIDAFIIGGSEKNSSVNGMVNVGGVVGKMTNSSLYGSQRFDLEPKDKSMAQIPDPKKFKSSFNGTVKGLKNVGGLVGYSSDSQLLHISSGAKIVEGGENIGGLVGYFATKYSSDCLLECTFTGEISSSSAENTGGIVGYYISTNEGLIENCINYGAVTGGYYTGGIVGYIRKEHDYSNDAKNLAELTWAVNAARVEGSFNVGGIVGRIYAADTKIGGNYIEVNEITVSNCMNAKDVIARGGNSEEALGGIAGRTGALTLVTRCANHAEIEGRGKLHAIGGIVGRLGQDSGFGDTFCYNSFSTENINTASINSTNADARIGGIAGYGEEGGYGTGYVYLCGVQNCRNSGKILPDQKSDTGGILGFGDNWILIASNFNNGKVDHGNAILGTQKTNGHQHWGYNYTLKGCGGSWPVDMTLILSSSAVTNEANFTDFDFNNIWEMTADGPNLRNNKWRDPSSAKMNF